MKKDEPMRNINPFGLRLQPELKARIEAAAAYNHRSINAEIVARLEETFLAKDMGAMEALNAAITQDALDAIDSWVATTPDEIEGQRDKLLTESIHLEQQLCMNRLAIKALMDRLQHVDEGQRGQITHELMLLRAKTEQLQIEQLEVDEQLKHF